MTTPLTPLEALALTDIETPWFTGEPANYCAAFGGRAEADLAIWRKSVRQRFPPGTRYRGVASVLGSRPAATDLPGGQGERLRQIGRTRQIERYEGETDEQYCERLASAHPTWQRAGTPNAIIQQLQDYGFVDVVVFEEYAGGFYDLSPPYGWRFVVAIGPDFGSVGWLGCLVGTAVVGTSTVGLGNGTVQQISAIKRLVVKWKQAFSFPLRVVLVFGDAPVVGLAIVGGAVVGGGTTTELPMGDARTVGHAIVGEALLTGFNL